ncbi:hypothetical protein D918_05664 [Trichuris suis]|nr:hypothetical protein D918_05664 [Trichuris suis]
MDLLQKYDGPTQKEKDALAKVQAELMERVKGYRDRCYPMPKDGCSCIEPRRVHRYETDEECRGKEPTKSIGPGKGPTTKERNAKAEVQEELMERVRGYRRRCYPMPVDGCRCDEILGSKRYATDAECRRKAKLQKYGALGNDTDGPSTKERNAKAEVQEELMERVRGYRRKCYPMPVDGCRCDEIRGPKRYATDAECRRKGPTTKERNEKAAMQAELMDRVKGYREKCYPMPVNGCSCQERRGVRRYDTDLQCRK